MVLELNSFMPATGGYYQWVKRALGLRWAFFEGWWTWLYTFCDLAIYPVIFVTYASFFIPEIAHYKVLVCLAIIWSSALLNIFGILPVGRVSSVLTILILIPFCFLFGMAFWHPGAPIHSPSLKGTEFSSLGLGLYYVMWNFLGWDNATTYAEEVNKPARSYLISVAISFGLVFVVYFLTLLATQHAGIDYATLKEQGYPLVGTKVGGYWLGVLISIGGMASAVGLFC